MQTDIDMKMSAQTGLRMKTKTSTLKTYNLRFAHILSEVQIDSTKVF